MLKISKYRDSYNKVLKVFGVEEVTQLDSNIKKEFYDLLEKFFIKDNIVRENNFNKYIDNTPIHPY